MNDDILLIAETSKDQPIGIDSIIISRQTSPWIWQPSHSKQPLDIRWYQARLLASDHIIEIQYCSIQQEEITGYLQQAKPSIGLAQLCSRYYAKYTFYLLITKHIFIHQRSHTQKWRSWEEGSAMRNACISSLILALDIRTKLYSLSPPSHPTLLAYSWPQNVCCVGTYLPIYKSSFHLILSLIRLIRP